MASRDEFRALLPEDKRDAFDDFVDLLESEVEKLKETVKERDEELDGRNSESDAALETVRYWLHDGLFLKRPLTSPMRLLQVVERALGVG